MFYIIRLVIACIAVLLALLFTKRTKNRKRIVAIVLVMVAVLYQLSVVFPIEQNPFTASIEIKLHSDYANSDLLERS